MSKKEDFQTWKQMTFLAKAFAENLLSQTHISNEEVEQLLFMIHVCNDLVEVLEEEFPSDSFEASVFQIWRETHKEIVSHSHIQRAEKKIEGRKGTDKREHQFHVWTLMITSIRGYVKSLNVKPLVSDSEVQDLLYMLTDSMKIANELKPQFEQDSEEFNELQLWINTSERILQEALKEGVSFHA